MKKLSWILTCQMVVMTGFHSAAQTPLKMRDTTIKGPQTFAMIMGISKYKYVRPLAYADKDAEMFRDYLKSPGGGSVKNENIFCLLNEKALNSNFWGKGFQWLKAKNLQKGDKLFIYLAGHGDAIDEDQFFFLGYDCNPGGDKNNYLVGGAIQLFNLKKKIAVETGKGVDVFFIMDACRSSELPGGMEGQNFLNTAISEKRAGEIIMLATGAGQESLEDASIGTGHGLFTYYLVDGLIGSADSIGAPDNKISYQEIKNYVDKNVPSAALLRFKRNQDPYFCCNENTEKVISQVDTAYLRKWLKTKKQQSRGPGNSFTGNSAGKMNFASADTALVETYDLFNKAIANNKLTGNASAEYYYESMNKRFPGTPYTLDAKSTLAVEFINVAQDKVNLYLDCRENVTPKQKQGLYESGVQLEKAITILKEDDPDFASSLMGRMYFLKASGDFGKDGKNGEISIAFQNAYAAFAIDPNGAYIQNKLALLHLENNGLDSAIYYAEKATKTAPKWACALATLSLIKKAAEQSNADKKSNDAGRKPIKKNSFGIVAGSGVSQLKPAFTKAANSEVIAIDPKNILKLDLGIIYQAGIGKNISIRPTALVSMEGGELVYERRATTGGPITRESIRLKTTSVSFSLPVIIRFSDENVAPYISLGPTFNYILHEDANASSKIPIKKSVIMGNAGLGIDFSLGKSGLMLSPELRYEQGFNNLRKNAGTEFTNTLSSLKKRGIVLSFYLRKK
jgi:Caspase domain